MRRARETRTSYDVGSLNPEAHRNQAKRGGANRTISFQSSKNLSRLVNIIFLVRKITIDTVLNPH
jgi:hypothetical protein